MCLQFGRNADDLPAGDETLCPPRLTIDAFTPFSPSVYDGFWVAASSGSNRDVYSSEDDA